MATKDRAERAARGKKAETEAAKENEGKMR